MKDDAPGLKTSAQLGALERFRSSVKNSAEEETAALERRRKRKKTPSSELSFSSSSFSSLSPIESQESFLKLGRKEIPLFLLGQKRGRPLSLRSQTKGESFSSDFPCSPNNFQEFARRAQREVFCASQRQYFNVP